MIEREDILINHDHSKIYWSPLFPNGEHCAAVDITDIAQESWEGKIETLFIEGLDYRVPDGERELMEQTIPWLMANAKRRCSTYKQKIDARHEFERKVRRSPAAQLYYELNGRHEIAKILCAM